MTEPGVNVTAGRSVATSAMSNDGSERIDLRALTCQRHVAACLCRHTGQVAAPQGGGG